MTDAELVERIARQCAAITRRHWNGIADPRAVQLMDWDNLSMAMKDHHRALARAFLPVVKAAQHLHPKCYCPFCKDQAKGMDEILRPWVGEDKP